MTEYDLLSRKRAERRLNIAREKLEAYEGVIYAPATQRITGMPFESHDNADRMAEVASRHEELLKAVSCAQIEFARAEGLLGKAEKVLNDDESGFLHNRYRLYLKWEEIQCKMHFSDRNLCRIRSNILRKIEKMAVNAGKGS